MERGALVGWRCVPRLLPVSGRAEEVQQERRLLEVVAFIERFGQVADARLKWVSTTLTVFGKRIGAGSGGAIRIRDSTIDPVFASGESWRCDPEHGACH